jgi:hypothetical protein
VQSHARSGRHFSLCLLDGSLTEAVVACGLGAPLAATIRLAACATFQSGRMLETCAVGRGANGVVPQSEKVRESVQ